MNPFRSCGPTVSGLVHELEMYARAIARHGAIEGWFPMQEVDRETESGIRSRPGKKSAGGIAPRCRLGTTPSQSWSTERRGKRREEPKGGVMLTTRGP